MAVGDSCWDPLNANVPDHAPDAVAEVELPHAQVIVVEPSLVILGGFAEIVAVGFCAAAGFTVTVIVPDLVGSCTDVEVMATGVVALTDEAEEKTPAAEIVPALEGLTLHVTAEL